MSLHAVAFLVAILSLALGLRGFVHQRHERRGGLRRLGELYDRSVPGRRLDTQLWAAQIDLSPSGWRCAQLLVAIPLTTTLLAIGAAPVLAVTASLSLSRLGGRLLCWLLRGRSRQAIAASAPALARALATELAAWGSGTHAVLGAGGRCREVRAVDRVMQLAAARVALGAEPGPALARALAQAEPDLPAGSPFATVIAIFGMYRYDTAATAVALDRLAAAIEDDGAVRREARAAVGEVRMSALAVPAIAAATLGVLLSTDPPALAATLSFPLLPLLGIAALVVAIAAFAARRLVVV